MIDSKKLDIIGYWCVNVETKVRKDTGYHYIRLEYFSATEGDYIVRYSLPYSHLSEALDAAYNTVITNAWEACK